MTCSRICKGLCSLFIIVFVLTFIIALTVVIRTLTLKEPNYQEWNLGQNVHTNISIEFLNTVPNILGGAIAYRTTSTSPGQYDQAQILLLHDYLQQSFPLIYKSDYVEVEVINSYSILYSIKGNDTSVEPYLLAAHMDVVPVDIDAWKEDPWLGDVVTHFETGEQVIWGRGAIDDKTSVITILSAIESLLSSDWTPRRSFYVALGHDEEVGGMDGAYHIGETLLKRNVSLSFVLDEGMPILDGVMQGVDVPVATIGVTEKGWMNIRLKAEGTGGHSSIPPRDQAVHRLAKAVHRLYEYPQPSMFGKGPEVDMFNYIAPHASWPHKLLFANMWLFSPILEAVMLKGRETSAILRTTTAVTVVNAGIKDNVIPAHGEALINHRVHPGQTLEEVVKHDQDIINDPSVKLTVEGSREAHPISPYGPQADGYRLIASAVKKVYPDAVPVPSLMIANTDTRHYLSLSRQVYRFLPVKMTKSTVSTIHGNNEAISLDSVKKAVQYYSLIILTSDDYLPLQPEPGQSSGEL